MGAAVTTRVPLSLRLPENVVQQVESYAQRHRVSKTDAFLHYLTAGIEAEQKGSITSDLSRISTQLEEVLVLLKRETPNLTTEQVSEAIRSCASKRPAIERAVLFGSFARGDFTESSDIDVRLELDPDIPFNLRALDRFAKDLERSTQRTVDVVTARIIKNDELRRAIEQDGVIVYERKEGWPF